MQHLHSSSPHIFLFLPNIEKPEALLEFNLTGSIRARMYLMLFEGRPTLLLIEMNINTGRLKLLMNEQFREFRRPYRVI